MITGFHPTNVILTDAYAINALEKEIDYLVSLSPDRLLSHFRKTAGMKTEAQPYDGWENTEIRGHTMGHYLSALAHVCAANPSRALRDRLAYIIEELTLCQMPSGYVSAFPEEFFDRVEEGKPVWVPWYTMHKLVSGILAVARLEDGELARNLVSRLGDWVYTRTSAWSEETRLKVLSVEYGGMNDCMYDLFMLTGKEEHQKGAHAFDETALFEALHEGRDVLNNRHANTTIPKFLGAVNRYIACGKAEGFYLRAAENFWDIVTNHHSYATGGNSEWEHFGEPDILDAERTETNCETCNTHNMLRLSARLFCITGKKKYAEYYERAFYNTILSSQNPETGMTTYFQPMATGFFKVFSRPFDHFWCCTGTGMENFSTLNQNHYFHSDDTLYVNTYISSRVFWIEKGLEISQTTDVPLGNIARFTVSTVQPAELTLAFRLPDWSCRTSIRVNGAECAFREEGGYALIRRSFADGQTVEVIFDIQPSLSPLPDNENAVAFSYGPLVLSAALGADALEESTTGIMVRIPVKQQTVKDYIVVRGNLDEWKKNAACNVIRKADSLSFTLRGTDEDERLVFTPHYAQYRERYGIYWVLVEEGSNELKRYIGESERLQRLRESEIDCVLIGNDQYELSHNVRGEETEAGDRDGFHYRFAKKGGRFSYELKVLHGADTYLHYRYMSGDSKRGFTVSVNGTPVAEENCAGLSWRDIIERSVLIPREIVGTHEAVTIMFTPLEDDCTARIIDRLWTSALP